MSTNAEFSNPLKKFKLVFLGEQSGMLLRINLIEIFDFSTLGYWLYKLL